MENEGMNDAGMVDAGGSLPQGTEGQPPMGAAQQAAGMPTAGMPTAGMPAASAQPAGQNDWHLSAGDFDGQDISPEFINGYSAIAKELGMSRENSVELLSKAADLANRMDVQAVEQQQNEWIAQAWADPEFGGASLNANLAIAKKALDAFGGEPLKEILEATGYGSHPEVIRFFWKVGQAVSEDSFQRGQTGSRPASFEDMAKRLYPSMQ